MPFGIAKVGELSLLITLLKYTITSRSTDVVGYVQELRSMFEKQAGVEKFDLIQSFYACKQESGKIQKANKKSLNAKGKNKVNGKGKDKKVYIPKPNNPKPTAKERPTKDDACHHCKEVRHWKRNLSCVSMLIAEEEEASWLCQICFSLNGGAVDWKSSKQSTTAMSATESEYIFDQQLS
ncbi:hypothetical protein Tco_0976880 [Tanacetum coccineum]|uniref:Uncharacterized protein n=1 Tax=Tanacetum coccineum TaxID=301880 RepID=A0ABQ5EIV8_9ASTR